MDLVKPALIGIGMTILGVFGSVLVGGPVLSRMELSFGAQLVAIAIPVAAGATIGGGLAARAHAAPQRHRPARHLLAALLGPGLLGLLSAAFVDPSLEGSWWIRLLNLGVPIAAAWTGVRWLDREPGHSTAR